MTYRCDIMIKATPLSPWSQLVTVYVTPPPPNVTKSVKDPKYVTHTVPLNLWLLNLHSEYHPLLLWASFEFSFSSYVFISKTYETSVVCIYLFYKSMLGEQKRNELNHLREIDNEIVRNFLVGKKKHPIRIKSYLIQGKNMSTYIIRGLNVFLHTHFRIPHHPIDLNVTYRIIYILIL